MPRVLHVYNLKLEWPDEPMEIGPYRFVPVEGYSERYKELQHLGSPRGADGSIEATTGGHQITGTVAIPNNERTAALGWGHEDPTELDDILLLLSLFTGRKVFVLDPGEEKGPIIADPREFKYGGSLGLSLGRVTRPSEWGTDDYAINLSAGTSQVNETIRSEAWQATYGPGHFLFLFHAACHRQVLETSFILCWVIWEHLFAVHNERWLSEKTLKRMPVEEKLAYILTKYDVRSEVPKEHRKKLTELARVRHLLVHDGRFTDAESQELADIFARLTEIIIAKIIGLEASNVFSPEERFDRFLNSRQLI